MTLRHLEGDIFDRREITEALGNIIYREIDGHDSLLTDNASRSGPETATG